MTNSSRLIVEEGMLDDKPARFLLDTGADYSLIPSQRAKTMVLAAPLILKFADGSQYTSTSVVAVTCKIGDSVQEMKLRTCNIDDEDYDVILGLDWFRLAKPMIDWSTGTVTFPVKKEAPDVEVVQVNDPKSEASVEVTVEPTGSPSSTPEKEVHVDIISWKDIPQDDETDLFLLAPELDEAEVASVPSVNKAFPKELEEYQDVFVDEIQELPPLRAVNHEIKLQPGNEPPKCRPYRMSSAELDEVKRQLDLLLEGNDFRSHFALWRASSIG